MGGVLASEKRTARQVQPPSAKNGAGSLTLSAEIRRHRWLAVRARARSRCRRVRRALLVSCAAAQAALHERLALGTLQSLRLGVRVAALHLLRLAIGPRGGRARGTGRARDGACRGLRALLGETTLHERLALGAHQSLRLRIRTAGRHLFLLAARLRSLSEGACPARSASAAPITTNHVERLMTNSFCERGSERRM